MSSQGIETSKIVIAGKSYVYVGADDSSSSSANAGFLASCPTTAGFTPGRADCTQSTSSLSQVPNGISLTPLIHSVLGQVMNSTKLRGSCGKFKWQRESDGMTTFRTRLNFPTIISTTAGKILSTSYITTPSSSFLDWTGFASIFDIYRCHGGRLRFLPIARYQNVSGNLSASAMLMIYDSDNTTQPTWTNAFGYDLDSPNVKLGQSADPMTLTYRSPVGIVTGSAVQAANTWCNTASPVNQGAVFVLSDTNAPMATASALYGTIIHSLDISFAIRQ